MESVTVTVAGVERRYLLADANVSARRPVVVFLHGAGGTAAWADDETGWSAVAAREGFVLAIPEGLPPDPAKPPKFLTNPQRWTFPKTELASTPLGFQRLERSPHSDETYSDADDVAFIAAVIGDVVNRSGGDPRRVYLTGFSNGAAMAFRFAAERADLLAALAPVAGYCGVPDPRPARPVPTLYVIGTEDPLVPLRGGQVRLPWGGRLVRRPPVIETLETWAAALECTPVPETVSDDGGVREEVYSGPVEFRAVYVEGLGHHWPGGKGQLNPRIGGQPSNQLNANEVIWGFFKRHKM